MSIIEDIQKSEFWQSAESRAALLVTGVLIIIAGFLIYNYYEKTGTDESTSNTNTVETSNQTTSASDKLSNAGETLSTQDEKNNSYVVKDGDTLWSIADKQLGDPYRWTEIKELNQLKSSEVTNGQVLTLPEKKVLAEEKTTTTPVEETKEVAEAKTDTENKNGETLATTAINHSNTYTVEHGDTLWSIAEKIYGDPYKYVEILNVNPNLGRLPDGNVLIHAGNVINLPQI